MNIRSFSSPEGGYITWVELPHGGADAIGLYHRALQRGLSIARGPLFSSSGRYRQFIRLNYALVEYPDMAKGLSILNEWLDRQG